MRIHSQDNDPTHGFVEYAAAYCRLPRFDTDDVLCIIMSVKLRLGGWA